MVLRQGRWWGRGRRRGNWIWMNLHKVLLLTHRVSWAFHLCFFLVFISRLVVVVVVEFFVVFMGSDPFFNLLSWGAALPTAPRRKMKLEFYLKNNKSISLISIFPACPFAPTLPSLSQPLSLAFQMLPRTQNTRKVSTNKPTTYVANIFHHAMPCNN